MDKIIITDKNFLCCRLTQREAAKKKEEMLLRKVGQMIIFVIKCDFRYFS